MGSMATLEKNLFLKKCTQPPEYAPNGIDGKAKNGPKLGCTGL